MLEQTEEFPQPPEGLAFGEVRLKFVHVVPGDDLRGLAPFYHFRILRGDGQDAGHINFKVGDTDHVRLYVGHIGYAVEEAFRGHGYAFQACRALAPFILSRYPSVIITTDPENRASVRTIERLGATFINKVTVPPEDVHYRPGRIKMRYEWIP